VVFHGQDDVQSDGQSNAGVQPIKPENKRMVECFMSGKMVEVVGVGVSSYILLL